MFKITVTLELDEAKVAELLTQIKPEDVDPKVNYIAPTPKQITKVFSKHGKFPEQWEKIAETLIKKFVPFKISDITGKGKFNDAHLHELRKWLQQYDGLNVQRVNTGKGAGRPHIYTPFYMENGRKTLASDNSREVEV